MPAHNVSATIACAPAGSVFNAQTSPFADCVTEPVLGAAVIRLTLEGNTRASSALVAALGPRLEITRLHGNVLLVWTENFVAEALSARSVGGPLGNNKV